MRLPLYGRCRKLLPWAANPYDPQVPYTLQPWQDFLAALADWINRHQQAAIDFLREENRVLLEQLGDRRIRLTDDQRRRLAIAGKAVGR